MIEKIIEHKISPSQAKRQSKANVNPISILPTNPKIARIKKATEYIQTERAKFSDDLASWAAKGLSFFLASHITRGPKGLGMPMRLTNEERWAMAAQLRSSEFAMVVLMLGSGFVMDRYLRAFETVRLLTKV